MLFITSNFHNWVWKLISKIDCTICFLGMCSCYNYLYFKLFFFFVKLLLLLKWLDSTYCCFIVESYSAPSVSASLLGIKITWEEGNIKQNLILVILSAQMCLVYLPGATITGKNIAESAGKKARSCSPSKTGTQILHGEGRGRWGSVLCPLSPENREVTGWTVGAGLPQVSGCMFMTIGLPKTLLFGQSRQSSEQARTDAFAMLGSVLQIRDWQSSVTLHGWYFP